MGLYHILNNKKMKRLTLGERLAKVEVRIKYVERGMYVLIVLQLGVDAIPKVLPYVMGVLF